MRSVLKTVVFVQVGLLVGLGAAASASAQVLFPLTVSGKEARATIALPGGIGAELTISFAEVVGLHPDALEVWATLIDPLDLTLLTALLARLPPADVAIPAGFPVLLEIRPAASSALTFAGVASVSLYTHNLNLNPAAPLALYKAHGGGSFHDVMTSEGRGSYRGDGSTGDFSEFLIVIDNRPIDTVIVAKFDALQALLTEHGASMSATVAGVLQDRLLQARTLYESGMTVAAIGELIAFSRYVKAHSGRDIPDVWRANDTAPVNVAGRLRAGADTLKFSLDRKTSQ